MTPDTSGPMWLVPLAHYDPDSSCWRTSQGMFPLDWPTSSETCPRWGMTRGGELFELPKPEPPTVASDGSVLLPTPMADDRRNSYGTGDSRTFQSLANTAVTELFPTPTARDWKDTGNFTPHPEKSKLPHTIAAMLPTPKAGDGERGRDVARPRADSGS